MIMDFLLDFTVDRYERFYLRRIIRRARYAPPMPRPNKPTVAGSGNCEETAKAGDAVTAMTKVAAAIVTILSVI
jgi:hypothetical protein